MKKVTILLQYILVHSLSTLTVLTFINYIPQDLRCIARLYADDIYADDLPLATCSTRISPNSLAAVDSLHIFLVNHMIT